MIYTLFNAPIIIPYDLVLCVQKKIEHTKQYDKKT